MTRRWSDDDRDRIEESLAREGHDDSTRAVLRRFMDGAGAEPERKKQPPKAVGRRAKATPSFSDYHQRQADRKAKGGLLRGEDQFAPGKAASNRAVRSRAVRRHARTLERLHRDGLEGTEQWGETVLKLAAARALLNEAPAFEED